LVGQIAARRGGGRIIIIIIKRNAAKTISSQTIMMLRIDIHRWFAMAAILNPKWSPKYKNPPIWKKFDFQVDYDVAN
jgi:hypothetical protein